MNVISIFTGIEGFGLGLEEAGMKVTAQIEIDDYCNKVLKKRYPEVRRWRDIKDFNSMLHVEGFRAKIFPTWEMAPVYSENALVCGGKCYKPFAWYDQNTQSWRTWQTSLTGEWVKFSDRWPKAGMIRPGIAYQLVPSVPPMFVREWLSLRPPERWQTPRSGVRGLWADNRRRSDGGEDLESQLAKTGLSGYVNPEWAEWLMGFPIGWTETESSGTPLSQKSQNISEAV